MLVIRILDLTTRQHFDISSNLQSISDRSQGELGGIQISVAERNVVCQYNAEISVFHLSFKKEDPKVTSV